jgi:hypothetical protein
VGEAVGGPDDELVEGVGGVEDLVFGRVDDGLLPPQVDHMAPGQLVGEDPPGSGRFVVRPGRGLDLELNRHFRTHHVV